MLLFFWSNQQWEIKKEPSSETIKNILAHRKATSFATCDCWGLSQRCFPLLKLWILSVLLASCLPSSPSHGPCCLSSRPTASCPPAGSSNDTHVPQFRATCFSCPERAVEPATGWDGSHIHRHQSPSQPWLYSPLAPTPPLPPPFPLLPLLDSRVTDGFLLCGILLTAPPTPTVLHSQRTSSSSSSLHLFTHTPLLRMCRLHGNTWYQNGTGGPSMLLCWIYWSRATAAVQLSAANSRAASSRSFHCVPLIFCTTEHPDVSAVRGKKKHAVAVSRIQFIIKFNAVILATVSSSVISGSSAASPLIQRLSPDLLSFLSDMFKLITPSWWYPQVINVKG